MSLFVLLVLASIAAIVEVRTTAPSTGVLDVARHGIKERALLIIRRLLLVLLAPRTIHGTNIRNVLPLSIRFFVRPKIRKSRIHPREIKLPRNILLLRSRTKRTRRPAPPTPRTALPVPVIALPLPVIALPLPVSVTRPTSTRREPTRSRSELFEWDDGRTDGLSCRLGFVCDAFEGGGVRCGD